MGIALILSQRGDEDLGLGSKPWLGFVESTDGGILRITTSWCSYTSRLLRKSLLEFLAVFLRRLRGVSKPWLWSGERVYAGDFALSLTVNLNLTDSPQYYDLPVLESTLECLVEMTAISGFSTASKLIDPKELCVDILTSLLQARRVLCRVPLFL
jgi:hypothetical protein